MDSKKFSHQGTVIEVGQGFLRVSVESQGACGGCSARAKCGMVDTSTRVIKVEEFRSKSYSVGQRVNVAISQQMGITSVIIAYVIPLILLVGALVALTTVTSEGVAALVSLAAVGLYYVGVYIFRSKLDKQIKFTIEK